MRIAVVNRTFGGMSGGYRRYCENVLPRLAEHRRVDAVLCVAPRSWDIGQWIPQHAKLTVSSSAPLSFFSSRMDRVLARELSRWKPDAVFFPSEYGLAETGFPCVLMIQNLAPLVPARWQNPWRERARLLILRSRARSAATRADRIIAPSRFVEDVVHDLWDIPLSRIAVIAYGAPTPVTQQREQQPLGLAHDIAGNFLFTAGSLEPYRGLEDLLAASVMLLERGIRIPVMIASTTRPAMRGYERRLKQQAVALGIGQGIMWIGSLSPQEMAWCYRHCSAFVMTSRLESFGFTGLEALSYGCLSIVAENPPLPEIFGDAASFYPSSDGHALARTIERLLAEPEKGQEAMRHAAKARAAGFSWDRNVENLLSVFQDAIAAQRP